MSAQLHPIEAAWRRFRNCEHAELLWWALKSRPSSLDCIGVKHPPAEVPLPGAVLWNLVARDQARERGERAGDWISVEGSLLVNTIHVWAAYREAKTIYTIEPYLAECLSRTPWPERMPTAALRLSSRCPVLSIPRGDTTIHLAAVHDLVTGAEDSGALELGLSQFEDDTWIPLCILDMREEDLGACLEAAARKAQAGAGFWSDRALADLERAGELWGNTTAGLALTILLYLSGEPDVAPIVHPGEKPAAKESIRGRDPERFQDLRAPTEYTVGKTFTRAIERWEIEHGREAGAPTGTVRPHMRRAHAHLYWTGPGRTQPRVRFLLPISIKGGRLTEEPERATETMVR